MIDDELGRLLAASNPASTPTEAPLSVRQRALMERIVTETPAPHRSLSRFALLAAAPVAAMLAIVFIAVTVLQPFAASPAAAFGPPALVFEPTNMTLNEVVRVSREQLDQSLGVDEPVRQATSTAWNLNVSEDGTAARTTVVAPTVTELSWMEDLSGTWRVVAGQPYLAEGEGDLASSDAPEAGAVLDERVFGPGEFPAQIPNAGDLEPARLGELLSAFAPDSARAGDAFLALHAVLNEWTLTSAQHSAFLARFLEYDNLTVLGTTTDRSGRAVIGLEGPTNRPGQSATLLISTATGRIIGLEVTVTDGDNPLKVPSGTVISYTLWEDQ